MKDYLAEELVLSKKLSFGFKILQKTLVDPIEKLPQISWARCLAYILDFGMTHIDWKETCWLVNEPGNYLLSNYNNLHTESDDLS